MAVVAVGAVAVLPASAEREADRGLTGDCALLLPGSDATTSQECLVCHGPVAYRGHLYDLHYSPGRSTSAAGDELRPLAEVLRRGLFLPNGEIRCVTCHDGASPWRFQIRLPPGSKPTHAVDLQRPQTYENPGSLPPPHRGDSVGVKPLCLGCHALD